MYFERTFPLTSSWKMYLASGVEVDRSLQRAKNVRPAPIRRPKASPPMKELVGVERCPVKTSVSYHVKRSVWVG